jgi:hypothetical protein
VTTAKRALAKTATHSGLFKTKCQKLSGSIFMARLYRLRLRSRAALAVHVCDD